MNTIKCLDGTEIKREDLEKISGVGWEWRFKFFKIRFGHRYFVTYEGGKRYLSKGEYDAMLRNVFGQMLGLA